MHPTHPVRPFAYYLAPLWDQGFRKRAEEAAAGKRRDAERRAGFEEQKGRVPQELRQKLKKSKGAKSLLQELEEEVRAFVKEWETQRAEEGRSEVEIDSEDEEIVFVGRNGVLSDDQRKSAEEQLQKEKLVFDSLADDHGASFGYVLIYRLLILY